MLYHRLISVDEIYKKRRQKKRKQKPHNSKETRNKLCLSDDIILRVAK